MNISTQWLLLLCGLLMALMSWPVSAQPKPKVVQAKADKPKPRGKSRMKQPLGTEILWDKTWKLKDCRWKDLSRCLPSSRYRAATKNEKKKASWKKAIQASRFLVNRNKKEKGTFFPFRADGVRYAVYLVTGKEGSGVVEGSKLDTPVRGAVLMIRKVQDKPVVLTKGAKASIKNRPYEPAKKPRGVVVYWKWAWNKKECELKKRKQCVPPVRYRPVEQSEKGNRSWNKAVQTARYLLSGSPEYGAFIPFKAGGVRYVAYISPHTATDIDVDGDGKLERVPLDEPVRGVTVYIRKVQ